MSAGEIIALVVAIMAIVGLGGTWVRNGKSQAKRDGIMEEKVNGINKRLEDPNTGLGSIKRSVDKQALHCAKMTSSFIERFKNLEGD